MFSKRDVLQFLNNSYVVWNYFYCVSFAIMIIWY